MRVEKKEENKDAIEILEDVRVGEYILEKGDKIVILEADDEEDEDEKEKDGEDDKKDDEKKDEKKEARKAAILKKMNEGETLSMFEKRFVRDNF